MGQAFGISPNVVIVPFFIADGLHSYQDIPVLIGIEADRGACGQRSSKFSGEIRITCVGKSFSTRAQSAPSRCLPR